ncbi:MAG: hypothetical protein AAFQ98_11200 [Bacteroidota bacterium]
MSWLRYFLLITLLVGLATCHKVEQGGGKPTFADCGCDSLWADSTTQEFVDLLETTTRSNHPIWKGYPLGDAAFVLYAGLTQDSTHCLGLWKQGEAMAYLCSADIPSMLTPLYSYYLNYPDTLVGDAKLFGTYQNAPIFSAWMEENEVDAAVFMPTDFPKFPFKIPAKVKTQLAIHEAFHIEVTLRKWYTGKGFWPKWDVQPDRAQVQNCYLGDSIAEGLIDREQETLALLVEALLDQDKPEAMRLAEEFLEARQLRYDHLEGTEVSLTEQTQGDCQAGEALMEIEEGIADYASWVKMFDIGTVSREDLLRRYRAKQKDKFYLTGCMLLHASVLMSGGKEMEVISKMVNAPSLEEGSLLTVFKAQLATYRESGS